MKTKGGFEALFDDLRSYFDRNITSRSSVPSDIYRGNSFYHQTVSKQYKKDQEVRGILIDLGIKLICSPKVFESIKQACLQICHDRNHSSELETTAPGCICPILVSPDLTIKFLKSWRFTTKDKCKIENLPTNLTNTVLNHVDRVLAILRFCLKREKTKIRILQHIPLLLTND